MIEKEHDIGKVATPPAAMRGRGWNLDSSAFGKLLSALGDDTATAAERYEVMRRKLTRIFLFWGADLPDELTDETMDRVARKLDEGEVIRSSDAGPFIRGVARLVFLESLRKKERDRNVLEFSASVDAVADEEKERRFACLDQCLGSLAPEHRDLILRYYTESGSTKIESRRRLAEELQVSSTALRIRAHRLREKLEGCVRSCAGGAE